MDSANALNDSTIHDLATRVAMHVVVATTNVLNRERCERKETAIYKEQSANPTKKPEILERVVAGKFQLA